MKPLQMLPIAALVGSIFGNPVLAADEAAIETTPVKAEIKAVRVKGKHNASTTVERVKAKTIQEQMIRDTRDLVRYSSDVGVSDDGRRMKGFAMRGVEDNRVGISIDGVALPSSEENSLYARYGNFNNSRLSIDTELVKGVDITKGADSFESGSGSLGGNVNYRTLDARDIVLPEQNFGALLRSGYASKNREWANTAGFGYAGNVFDAVVLYSRRHGHEMKSGGGDVVDFVGFGELDKQDQAERGSARIHPDPSKHNNHSYLVKLGWQPTDSHRFGFSVNGQNNSNYTYEKTYSLTSYWREADDIQKRTNINLSHEWTPASSVLSLLRTDLDYQKTRNGAINYKGDMVRTGDWRTGYQYHNGFMADRDERNMDTKYKRITFRLDSQPFSLWAGEHRLSFKTFASRRDFENVNDDLDFNSTGNITDRKHYTIIRPMKTDQFGFSLQDKIAFDDKLSVNAGVRYDYEKVKPQAFKPDTPCLSTCVNDGNPAARSFNTWNGVLGLDYRLNDTWRAAYQINTGHRVPTASEMYFTYTSPYGNWIANPSLKAERSLNQTLSLRGKNDKGLLDFSLYQTRYRNFLFEEEKTYQVPNEYYNEHSCYYNPKYCNPTLTEIGQQMVNIDKARVRGVEFKGELNLHQVMSVPEGFKVSGALGYSKGKLSGERGSLLSIQPLKLVLGFDYESPDERWGIFSRVSYMGRKKAKDAQVIEQKSYCTSYKLDPWTGKETDDCAVALQYRDDKIDFRWLNKAATVVDVFGYYKPVKRMTLRAGVYNLFNRKYHTWDSLRGINPRSTINSLSVSNTKSANQGLERYYAPGRNYAVSLEWKF
ncbi:TPA: TonB-dependent hemoglobin/transferrin/lactoferrin family receptor [Neisseria meningitidis]|uniref:TonB-dependent hemoglobin/transferrin/lactoferrin family receptor n=1 Tax=Neisseria meningitidis TaxID=487 RepID=UPI0018D63103|nr:TonB-dependent hemoglobin/transferrin/lactoferrin family receptor [Neisseria meningitidis]MBH2250162.1 TonB-dependent hemoglobin/transferrin/lactoferrin family receptor [Neisseria meningitidis]MBH5611358.1 TonB-dependent hemoglobin/transferrin/lactoferrin family receptor [Neisseria meningitidis]MBH5666988.1 TonB-dependent hemoglobin/transferrin/lactoferrin family receptor [Neisseria meningitidis]MBH5797582.1 TonB-dependent hemoglobin/transferrin/lactoferrin family receptor [Neisseria meningi